jgi:S1-C subfamily serine protease
MAFFGSNALTLTLSWRERGLGFRTIFNLIVLTTAAAGSALAAEPVPALEKALVAAIAKAQRCVVAIARVRRDQPGETLGIEARPDPFGRRAALPAAPGPTDPDFVPNEYGTGVIVDREGLILTAFHVLASESDYYVTTVARKVYRAQVKGADPRSDLAVLSIDAVDLQPIELGEAEMLKKGQIVIALGNPHGIARDGQASASWGIVSNLARKAPPLGDESDSAGRRTLHQFGTLIQTDARLNQTTSGGALVDLQGEMVGLTVDFAAVAGFEREAGYAIPIDATFRRVIDALKQGREVEYGFLGVRPASLRPQEVLEGQHGIRVQNVVPGTPADRYGLQVEDVITAVGEKPIYGGDDLMLEVGRLPVEATVRFHLLRGRRPLDVDVVLAKYPVQEKRIVTNPPPAWRGMRVDYLTAVPDLPVQGGLRSNYLIDGVAVVEVAEGKPAWKAGLRPGMIVGRVEDTAVRTPREFRAAVREKKGPVRLHLVNIVDAAGGALRTVEPER